MGTTAEKGARVLQSIAEVQEGINNLGGSLTDQTPFKDFKAQLDNIYDVLPKTSFQTGTEVTLENCLKGKLDFDTQDGKKVVGIGQSSQDTTNGYQMLNLTNGTYSANGITAVVENGGITLNGTCVNSTSFIVIPCTPYTLLSNVDYRLSAFNSFSMQGNNGVRLGPSGTTIAQFVSENNTRSIKYTSDISFSTIEIRTEVGTTYNNSFLKPMLEKGTTTHNWEKYTGGQASPNPSYSQEIKCVTGNQDVVVSGKNKLPQPFSNRTEDVTLTKNNDGTYVLNGSTGSSDVYIQGIDISSYGIKGKKLICMPSNWSSSNGYATPRYTDNTWGGTDIGSGTSLDSTKTALFIALLLRANSTFDNVILKPMITDDTSATYSDYEPYITPKSYQLSLGDKGLYDECTIVGSPDNWKFVDNRKKLVFNGSEDWAYNFNQSMFRVPVADVKYAPGGSVVANIKSNYYQAQPYTPLYEKQIDYGIAPGTTGNDYIYIRNNGITSVADFKTWLSTHNTEAVYETRQPIETPITDETLISQLNEWYNAHSNNGTTIITSNGNLPMIIKCRALKGE